MRVIGLTGGIASGKSTVQEFMNSLPVIDADLVGRDLLQPKSEALNAVIQAFGPELVDENGALNRAALRARIARSEDERRRLNAIMHPRIRQDIHARLDQLRAAGHDVAVVSAALMLETGSYRDYDAVVLVIAPEDTRLKRLMLRDGMTEELARELMAKQWPDDRKRPFADFIIQNDGDLESLKKRSDLVLSKITDMH